MKKILLLLIAILCLVFSAGCRWFADNPMFPTAKLRIGTEILDESGALVSTNSVGIISITTINTGNSINSSTTQSSTQGTTTSTQEGTITESSTSQSVSYVNTSSVTQEVSISFARSVKFTFYPLNKVGVELIKCHIYYYDEQGYSIPVLERSFFVYIVVPPLQDGTTEGVSWTVEIFSSDVQDYFLSNGITLGQAVVLFEGEDSAGHEVSYRATVGISAAMPETAVETPSFSTCQSCQ